MMMAHRRVINNYYNDINNLACLLNNLVNSYRLIIGSAKELNGITLANKRDVKSSLKRAKQLGKIIDNLIEALDNIGNDYTRYCNIKADIMKTKVECDYILTEIDEELRFKE